MTKVVPCAFALKMTHGVSTTLPNASWSRMLFLIYCSMATLGSTRSEQVVNVLDEIGFFSALTDTSVTRMVLVQDLKLRAEFWAHSWGTVNVSRSLVIEGVRQDPAEFVELDFAFISSKVALLDGVTLTFRWLSLHNAMSRMQLHYDFFVASPESSAIVWSDCLNHLMLCMPLDFAVGQFAAVPRPVRFSNDMDASDHQSISASNITFCRTEPELCYSPVVNAWDFAAQSLSGYVIWQRRVKAICDGFTTQSCIDTLGAQICYATTLKEVLATRTSLQQQQQQQQQQSQQQQAPVEGRAGSSGLSSGAMTGVIVGCVLAGTLLATLVAIVLLRRRHGGRSLEPGIPPHKAQTTPLDAAVPSSDVLPVLGAAQAAQAVSAMQDHRGESVPRPPGAGKGEASLVVVCVRDTSVSSKDKLLHSPAAAASEVGQFPTPIMEKNAHIFALAAGAKCGAFPADAFESKRCGQITSPFTAHLSSDTALAFASQADGARHGRPAAAATDSTASNLFRRLNPELIDTHPRSITTLGSALMSLFRSMVSGRGNSSIPSLSQPGTASGPRVGGLVGTDTSTLLAFDSAAAATAATAPSAAVPAGHFLTHTGSFHVSLAAGARSRCSGDESTAGSGGAGGAGGACSSNTPSNITLRPSSSTEPLAAGAASRELLLVQEVLLSAANASRGPEEGPAGTGGSGITASGGDAGYCSGGNNTAGESSGEQTANLAAARENGTAGVVAGLDTEVAVAAQEVMLGPIIGAGSFGKVYRGTWRGAVVAVKVISHDRHNTLASIENELRLSLSFNHRNVVRALSYIMCSVDESGNPTLTIQSKDVGSLSRLCMQRSGSEGKSFSTLGFGDGDDFSCPAQHGMIDGMYDGRRGGGGNAGPAGGGGGGCVGNEGALEGVDRAYPLPRDVAETWVIQEYMPRGTLSTFIKQGGLSRRCPPTLLATGSARLRIASLLGAPLQGPAVPGSGAVGSAPGSPVAHSGPPSSTANVQPPVKHRSCTGQPPAAPNAIKAPGGAKDSSLAPCGSGELIGGAEGCAGLGISCHQGSNVAVVVAAAQAVDAAGGGATVDGAPWPQRRVSPSTPGAAADAALPSQQPQFPQQRLQPRQSQPQTLHFPQMQRSSRPGSAALSRGSVPALVPDMRRVVLCALDIARGLEYLHGMNVCHGDLKPGNILLAEDPDSPWGLVAKLADFGMSRAVAADKTHLTTKNYGTVSYMCPLVLETGKVSRSSCVYSYGIILWELVSGRPPYQGSLPGQIMKGVMLDDMRPDFGGLSGVPQWYSELAQRCWAKQPADRPAMSEVVSALEAKLTCDIRCS